MSEMYILSLWLLLRLPKKNDQKLEIRPVFSMGKHTMDFIFKVSGKTNFPHKILHSDKLLYNSEGRMKCFLGKE